MALSASRTAFVMLSVSGLFVWGMSPCGSDLRCRRLGRLRMAVTVTCTGRSCGIEILGS